MSSASATTEPVVAASVILEHLEAGRLQVALDAANAALSVCVAADQAMLLCTKCNALVMLGNPLAALRVATLAREVALAQAEPLTIAEAGLALAFALQALEEHSRVIDLMAECEAIAQAENDLELLARSMRILGISYSVLGRHEAALDLLNRVVTMLAQHARAPERMFHARYSLIAARSRVASASSASEPEKRDLYRSLRAEWLDFVAGAAARNLLRLQAMALGNAGVAARLAGDLDDALATLQQTLTLQYQVGLRSHAAVTEGHVGATLQSKGRATEAIAAFKRSIALHSGGNPRDLASTWEELAGAYESVDDPRAALAALKQARALERKLHDDAALLAAAKIEQKAEIAKLAEQWTRAASEDPLTGLANRRAFDTHLRHLIDAAECGGGFALVLFDLDFFKQVNDGHGHGVGDLVLKRFAALLQHERRASDLAARIGGEEFALLLATETATSAHLVAERIRENVLQEPWATLSPKLSITVSGGAASWHELSDAERSADALMALADRRLYLAKNSGRNRVVCTD
jgi:diguanylate cyclase (GGDEF)-like protein